MTEVQTNRFVIPFVCNTTLPFGVHLYHHTKGAARFMPNALLFVRPKNKWNDDQDKNRTDRDRNILPRLK
jgi:hypothetical protein